MSALDTYLGLWSAAWPKVNKQTKRIRAITYGFVLFCAILSVLLFVISAVELLTHTTIPYWIQVIPYLIASYAGLVGWYYGNI